MKRHLFDRLLALTGALTLLVARNARAQRTFPDTWTGRWVGTPTTYAPPDSVTAPPRQRAVLLLTQVLNWSAAEAA